jgi:AcrR family transcriptional regulator
LAELLVVELPSTHTGPVEIEVRQNGAVVVAISLPNPAVIPNRTTPTTTAVGEAREREIPNRTMSTTTAVGEAREREILDIACDVISAKGFATTSMRDIARAADVSIATMYRYIGSKDELLYRITATRMQELFDYFESNMTDAGTATDRLADAIAVYLDYISKNHRYINLVYRETKALDDDARARIYATERRFMTFWEDIIRRGIDDGEFVAVDVNLAANVAYFACTVWALRYWSIGDRPQRDVQDLLTKLVVGGLAR